ncbi:Phosphoglycerate mutase-like protein AT74 [Glycine max]|nr:Phosphoglycerate mutase-like protein AT74 [Glycine max]
MNAKRREDMIGVLPKRRILMRHEESQGNRDTTAYTTIPDHNIQSTMQVMAQALRAGKHHRVISSDGCSLDWRV